MDIMKKRVGILAGGGDFPLLAIENALKLNYDVTVIGFKNFFNPAKIRKYKSITYYEEHIGYLNKIVKLLKKENINEILFIGKIYKHIVLRERKFDMAAIKLLLTLKDKSDFSLLLKLVEFFKKNNITVISQKKIFQNIIAKKGYLSKYKLKRNIKKNIEWGYKIAKSIANLDIGQSVIVGDNVVISVEGIEGTDEMIKRSREYIFNSNKTIFIKVARKNYDERFDLPTVGLNTLRLLKKIGIKNVIVEANTVLLPHYEKIIKFANENHIVILGI